MKTCVVGGVEYEKASEKEGDQMCEGCAGDDNWFLCATLPDDCKTEPSVIWIKKEKETEK